MPPLRDIRKSRRLSRKSPVQVEDYDWQLQDAPSLPLLPHAPISLPSPSSSACTATDPDSPPLTHLPFTPGSSHTRNRKQGHIPRPPNAFMVFRSWLWNKDNLKSIERDNRNVSRIAGRYWNELSEAERAPFRSMAEEAKARHAQLYPEYKYSPGSQKKPKISAQRRSQRGIDSENAKCKKVTDLLSAAGRDIQKYDDGEHKKVGAPLGGQGPLSVAGDLSEGTYSIVSRNTFKGYEAPCEESLPRRDFQETKTVYPPTFMPAVSAPYTFPQHVLCTTEERSEATPTSGPSEHTPELAYPPNTVEEFVATDDIPYLSLDACEDLMLKIERDETDALYPSHLGPAAHSVFSGVKPQATSFVDSCVLGAYTADPLALVPVGAEFDFNSYLTLDTGLVPLGSPVFANPFEPSTQAVGHPAMFDTLDQLFSQPISPLTLLPTEDW